MNGRAVMLSLAEELYSERRGEVANRACLVGNIHNEPWRVLHVKMCSHLQQTQILLSICEGLRISKFTYLRQSIIMASNNNGPESNSTESQPSTAFSDHDFAAGVTLLAAAAADGARLAGPNTSGPLRGREGRLSSRNEAEPANHAPGPSIGTREEQAVRWLPGARNYSNRAERVRRDNEADEARLARHIQRLQRQQAAMEAEMHYREQIDRAAFAAAQRRRRCRDDALSLRAEEDREDREELFGVGLDASYEGTMVLESMLIECPRR